MERFVYCSTIKMAIEKILNLKTYNYYALTVLSNVVEAIYVLASADLTLIGWKVRLRHIPKKIQDIKFDI